MASVNSIVRTVVKPFLFKLMGKNGYKYAQLYGKMRDIKYRLVEEKEMKLLPLILTEGDTAFDIGANYAYYIERMSKLVGNNGKIYAFEPIPFTYDVCKMIVDKLNLKNVNLYPKGVSNKTEEVTFSVPKLEFGGISAGQAHIDGREIGQENKSEYYNFDQEEKVTCQVVDLDSFLSKEDLSRLKFVKIDIEGAEYYALQGMQGILNQYKPILLLEIQPVFLKGFGIDEQEFRNYLETDLNYILYKFNPESNKLVKFTGNFDDDNYILIHKDKIDEYNNLIST